MTYFVHKNLYYSSYWLEILLCVLLILSLSSCDEDNDSSIIMKDGVKINLINDKISHYETESEFFNFKDLQYECDYSFITNHRGPYYINQNYSISGYDDRFIINWEKASFGKWIEKYNLVPNNIYYCATIKYVIYLPIPSNQDEYVPIFPMEDMGYTSWYSNKSFDLEFSSLYPKYVFFTGYKYIGYDNNYIGIYKELPITNKIIWNFTVKN